LWQKGVHRDSNHVIVDGSTVYVRDCRSRVRESQTACESTSSLASEPVCKVSKHMKSCCTYQYEYMYMFKTSWVCLNIRNLRHYRTPHTYGSPKDRPPGVPRTPARAHTHQPINNQATRVACKHSKVFQVLGSGRPGTLRCQRVRHKDTLHCLSVSGAAG
jgi:hypothetical protein